MSTQLDTVEEQLREKDVELKGTHTFFFLL